MQAIELQAHIDEKHQIHLQVPEEWPPQQVKVIVLLESEETAKEKKRVFGQFSGKVHIADDFDAELPEAFWLSKDA
jgi:hypothetical protein